MKKILQALFYEYKDKGKLTDPEFSTKKTAAVVLCLLAVLDLINLMFIAPFTNIHWTITLAKAGVPTAVLVPMVSGEFGLVGWLFKIYKDGKAQGAA